MRRRTLKTRHDECRRRSARTDRRPSTALFATAWLLLGLACQDSADPSPASSPSPPRERKSSVTSVTPVKTVTASRYVGGHRCAECHAEQARLWRGSHHDLSMQGALPDTLLGDFEDVTFDHRDERFRFGQRAGSAFVETAGADGTIRAFEILHAFGVEPLQQYLVALEAGRLAALGVAWDSRPGEAGGQRWFPLRPDEAVAPGDLLHWTGPAGRWNTMCADCHSTNFEKGYDPERASYSSTWSEIDVACEACHGPGSAHVTWAERGADDAGEQTGGRGLSVSLGSDHAWRFAPGDPIAHRVPAGAPAAEVEACAACHARRAQIAEGGADKAFLDRYRPALLEEGLYHADGQILDEVYVWGSFLQSRMYAAGVACSDCHDPHGLTIEQPDAVCARCHQGATFAAPSHHHHEPGSEGASCVGCHMPTRTYMVIDERRDHSFRVPRPDLSLSIGVPNPCTGCHAHRSDAWAAETTAGWASASAGAPPASPHYGEILAAGRARAPGASTALARLAQDTRRPAIVRATAIELLGAQLSREALPAIAAGLEDPDPLLRMAALGATEALSPEDRWRAAERLLADPLRAVRIEAARVLAPMRPRLSDAGSRARLDRALADYRRTQALNADWPAAHVNLGILHAELGDLDASARAYRKAIELGPQFLPAYLNLADLHRERGEEAESEQVLREALRRLPDDAELHHALGLLFVRTQRTTDALGMLSRATTLAPGNPRYAYVHGVALHSTGDSERALEVLAEAHRMHPGSSEILVALATFHRDLGQTEQALVYARRLLALRPSSPEAQGLVRALEAASG